MNKLFEANAKQATICDLDPEVIWAEAFYIEH